MSNKSGQLHHFEGIFSRLVRLNEIFLAFFVNQERGTLSEVIALKGVCHE
jgi:hypothetical protein